MQLTPHFSLEEFTHSDKAAALGIDNSLPPELQDTAMATAQMLERIRAFLSGQLGRPVPIVLSSGYRCRDLNRAVGSKDTSDHIKAMAADWSAPEFGTPLQVCRALAPRINALAIGQLIHECPAPGRVWVHTSTRMPEKPVNRVITISSRGTELGIQEV